MIRHFFTIISMTALFAAVFTSCDYMVQTEDVLAGQIAVNLQAGIKPASTYAVNDQWEPGDIINYFFL